MVKFKENQERDSWDDSFEGELKNPIDPSKEYSCAFCGEKDKEHGWLLQDHKDSHLAFCSQYCSGEYYLTKNLCGTTIYNDIIYSKSNTLIELYNFVEYVQSKSEDPREGNHCSALLWAMEEEKLVIIEHNEKNI